MKPIEFPEVNLRLTPPAGMTDEQCGTLPVFTDGQQCASLWSLSIGDRIRVLLFGRVWLIVTGTVHPPVLLVAEKTIFKIPRDRWAFLKTWKAYLGRLTKRKGENVP